MRQSSLIEVLERRQFLTAAAHAVAVQVIGETSGLVAAANVPSFVEVHGSVHASDGTLLDDSDTGVDRDTSIKIKVNTNNTGSIDNTNLTRGAVKITDTTDNTVLVSTGTNADLSKVITSGGGDTLVISLKSLLKANHNYSVELNPPGTDPDDLIRTSDANGTTPFADTTLTFSVGTFFAQPTPGFTSAFSTAAVQTNAGRHSFTAVTMGPGDGNLYAADTKGFIYALPIQSDGSLGAPTVINSIRAHFGANRLITGIAFKPSSTAAVMELWVSSSQYRFGNTPGGSQDVQKYADNFTGEIDALSGAGLANVQPIVVNIPRSVKDHTNNQIVFAPDGKAAYFGIAAMNAMGAADATWGGRVENIYSATIMQLRLGSAENGINTFIHNHGGPVDLKIDGDQNLADGLTPGTLHYNVYNGKNPLRIWADGIRNDYDMVFANNGSLYAAINGSSSGGNTPATPSDLSTVPVANRLDKGKGTPLPYTGPVAPALTNVITVEEDTLLNVKNGAYYGHPNPSRGEYVLDGGNPTASDADPYQFKGNGTNGYATGQQPDRNYTLPVYDFGQNYSPNGIIQYKSVGGANVDLNNYLMVARYSSGGDILALEPKSDGSIGKVQARIPGLSNLGTPLDLTEDLSNGNLYVAVLVDETGNSSDSGSIQLLKPTTISATSPQATASATKLRYTVTRGGKAAKQSITLTNTGTADLVFDPTQSRIGGSGRKNFLFVGFPTTATSIVPGGSLTLTVSGQLLAGQSSPSGATLYLKTNDPGLSGGFVTALLRAYSADGT